MPLLNGNDSFNVCNWFQLLLKHLSKLPRVHFLQKSVTDIQAKWNRKYNYSYTFQKAEKVFYQAEVYAYIVDPKISETVKEFAAD